MALWDTVYAIASANARRRSTPNGTISSFYATLRVVTTQPATHLLDQLEQPGPQQLQVVDDSGKLALRGT